MLVNVFALDVDDDGLAGKYNMHRCTPKVWCVFPPD